MVLFFFVGFFSSGWIIKNFIKIFQVDNVTIASNSPLQLANVAIDIGIFVALMTALPIFIYHFFTFSYSALTKKEIKGLLFSIPFSIFLFLVGFSYGFFILFYSFKLLAVVNESLGIKNFWDIATFLSQTVITSALLGLVFQFPLVVSLLLRMQIISIGFLRQKRRIVILFLFILVSLLPPTDGLSLIAMALPLYLLYELTILTNLNKKHV